MKNFIKYLLCLVIVPVVFAMAGCSGVEDDSVYGGYYGGFVTGYDNEIAGSNNNSGSGNNNNDNNNGGENLVVVYPPELVGTWSKGFESVRYGWVTDISIYKADGTYSQFLHDGGGNVGFYKGVWHVVDDTLYIDKLYTYLFSVDGDILTLTVGPNVWVWERN